MKDLKNKWENAYRNTSLEQTISNLRNKHFSINENFFNEYDNWDKVDRSGNFTLGTTSKALRSIGLDDRSIVMDKTKI